MHSTGLKVNLFSKIKIAEVASTGAVPMPFGYLFWVARLCPLPRSHRQWESYFSEESKQDGTCHIKQREEKNMLGKHQTTYFMIFKCHFFAPILTFLRRINYRSAALGSWGCLSSAQLARLRSAVMVISYEFLTAEDQAAAKTPRGETLEGEGGHQ